MSKYKIAVLPGDGIGPEVMDVTLPILDRIGFDAEYTYGEIGWELWRREGDPLPERTIELLKSSDAGLFGAITSKPKDVARAELNPELQGRGLEYVSPLLRLRQGLKLHTNLRPCRAFPGVPGILRDDIDMVVFRENTEDLYAGIEFNPLPQDFGRMVARANPKMNRFLELPPEDVAVALRVISRPACRSIAGQAFKFAAEFGYKRVTLAEKSNVLRETGGMMSEEVGRIAADYPDIEYEEFNIDALTMHLVQAPQKFGVIVATNMFGDIVSDLCAQLAGGIGLVPSANLGDDFALFEPIHGSAPDIAGQGKANPMGMILSAGMMLDWLGEKDMADRLKRAAAQVIADGKTRTADLGGNDGTKAMAEAVTACL